MNDGLNDGERLAIINVLSRYPQVTEARLYGSRALARHHPSSDIDLSLLGQVDFTLLNSISLELDDLLLPYEIDLSVLSQIENAKLCEPILRVGRCFYKRA